ncbi:alkanesulfonate monooxygenase [Capronia coronata CBS 617.96]|uniref:Alkanesulfonate monooxygenase n=1 Tax=Capronia coronata CBS 617.96 TaxID=1182541 RepID=W9XT35_9EURO|nr:alkanesulfonate monooxygenase [Capronia coronata CBS 617.96]EXJ80495.1 alkanesulfonate monooxygenase [Capronia coronata CBS 617.96]
MGSLSSEAAKTAGLAGNRPPKEKKQLILNAFAMNTPGHLSPGLWRHPRNQTNNYKKLEFWTDLAQLLDRAGFHALFLADVLGCYDVYKGPANTGPALHAGAQFPVNDPLYLVPAMAAVTKNITFGVTASTTYEQPYSLARRFSTVDHLSNGRVAWNIVTSYLDSAARNFGLSKQVEHDSRYDLAEEYMEVLYKLWEGSWRDDAVVEDRETGTYAVPERVRQINHQGKHFNVPGPHICEPSPQRTPFLFQAGTSKSGRQFGAKHAEVIFAAAQLPEKLRPSVDAIRQLAKEAGRDPYHVKIIAGISVIIAETDEAARAKHEEYLSYGDREGALALFGGWTGIDLSTYSDDEDFRFVNMPVMQSIVNGWADTVPGSENLKWNKARIADYLLLGGMHPKIVGSPTTVADELERWVEIADVDGFNLSHITNPGSFEDMIEFLLPELRKRGIFRQGVDKEGATAREQFFGTSRLLSDHPGSKYRWEKEDEIPKYQQN